MPKEREELSVMRGTWEDLFVCVEEQSEKRFIYQTGDQDLEIMLTIVGGKK